MRNPSEIMFVSNSDDWPVDTKIISKWTIEYPLSKQIVEYFYRNGQKR